MNAGVGMVDGENPSRGPDSPHETNRSRSCPRCGAPELEETIPITDLCALCRAEDEERVASEEARR